MTAKFLTAGLMTCIASTALAQEAPTPKPKGQAIVQTYANFHAGFGATNDRRGFELERSYLGYRYDLGRGLSIRTVLDIGRSTSVPDQQRLAYLKHAELAWQHHGWTIHGGLISTTLFKYQERFWGYRYLMKSYQDAYAYGSSADLGLTVAYDLAPWLSADAIVVNGEGYKQLQRRDGLNYGLGFTIKPTKGLSLRLYGGVNEGSTPQARNVLNLAGFVGYDAGKYRLGAEYVYMRHAGHVADAHRSGFSVYGAVHLSPRTTLFARYDDQYSYRDWRKAKDEAVAVVGAEWQVGRYVKIAPNLRLASPKDTPSKAYGAGYVNFYFGL